MHRQAREGTPADDRWMLLAVRTPGAVGGSAGAARLALRGAATRRPDRQYPRAPANASPVRIRNRSAGHRFERRWRLGPSRTARGGVPLLPGLLRRRLRREALSVWIHHGFVDRQPERRTDRL